MFLNKRKIIYVISILILIFLFTYEDVKSQEVKVIDGDTINVHGLRVRFSGIDAPESNYKSKEQTCLINENVIPCGEISKKFLIDLINNEQVTCKKNKKRDPYNRILGECFINGESISRIMVKNGYAFDYPKYSKEKFAKEQKYAKENKLGLWSANFNFPWDFRDQNR